VGWNFMAWLLVKRVEVWLTSNLFIYLFLLLLFFLSESLIHVVFKFVAHQNRHCWDYCQWHPVFGYDTRCHALLSRDRVPPPSLVPPQRHLEKFITNGSHYLTPSRQVLENERAEPLNMVGKQTVWRDIRTHGRQTCFCLFMQVMR
jgi:hypothetical protein